MTRSKIGERRKRLRKSKFWTTHRLTVEEDRHRQDRVHLAGGDRSSRRRISLVDRVFSYLMRYAPTIQTSLQITLIMWLSFIVINYDSLPYLYLSAAIVKFSAMYSCNQRLRSNNSKWLINSIICMNTPTVYRILSSSARHSFLLLLTDGMLIVQFIFKYTHTFIHVYI